MLGLASKSQRRSYSPILLLFREHPFEGSELIHPPKLSELLHMHIVFLKIGAVFVLNLIFNVVFQINT